MARILLAVALVVIAVPAGAIEDLCRPTELVLDALITNGYEPLGGGPSDDGEMTAQLFINPVDGKWAFWTVEPGGDRMCIHMAGTGWTWKQVPPEAPES